MRGSITISLLALISALSSCSESRSSTGPAPKVFDALADFSGATNADSSVWSYRYRIGLARDGNYALIPSYGADIAETWSPVDPGAWELNGYLPRIGVNRTGLDDSIIGTSLTWPQDAMLLHEDYDGLVVLTWRSPSTAVVTIEFSFTSLHRVCGDGIDWFVEHNSGAATLASGSIDAGGSTGIRSLPHLQVQQGDRINFVVGPRGSYGCDSTKLTAIITAS